MVNDIAEPPQTGAAQRQTTDRRIRDFVQRTFGERGVDHAYLRDHQARGTERLPIKAGYADDLGAYIVPRIGYVRPWRDRDGTQALLFSPSIQNFETGEDIFRVQVWPASKKVSDLDIDTAINNFTAFYSKGIDDKAVLYGTDSLGTVYRHIALAMEPVDGKFIGSINTIGSNRLSNRHGPEWWSRLTRGMDKGADLSKIMGLSRDDVSKLNARQVEGLAWAFFQTIPEAVLEGREPISGKHQKLQPYYYPIIKTYLFACKALSGGLEYSKEGFELYVRTRILSGVGGSIGKELATVAAAHFAGPALLALLGVHFLYECLHGTLQFIRYEPRKMIAKWWREKVRKKYPLEDRLAPVNHRIKIEPFREMFRRVARELVLQKENGAGLLNFPTFNGKYPLELNKVPQGKIDAMMAAVDMNPDFWSLDSHHFKDTAPTDDPLKKVRARKILKRSGLIVAQMLGSDGNIEQVLFRYDPAVRVKSNSELFPDSRFSPALQCRFEVVELSEISPEERVVRFDLRSGSLHDDQLKIISRSDALALLGDHGAMDPHHLLHCQMPSQDILDAITLTDPTPDNSIPKWDQAMRSLCRCVGIGNSKSAEPVQNKTRSRKATAALALLLTAAPSPTGEIRAQDPPSTPNPATTSTSEISPHLPLLTRACRFVHIQACM